MALTGIQVGARTAARAATLHLRAGARWGHVRRLRERERERETMKKMENGCMEARDGERKREEIPLLLPLFLCSSDSLLAIRAACVT